MEMRQQEKMEWNKIKFKQEARKEKKISVGELEGCEVWKGAVYQAGIWQ